MNSFKSLASIVVLAALVLPLCIHLIQAQKTIANSFQQQQVGSNSDSVYGGYQSSSVNRPSSLSSPVNQRRPSVTQQTYKSRQPVYQPQQQQISSASNSYESSEQAEADAEPASYGSVSGSPGQDFPSYTQVPKTSFSCDNVPYDYGMYADEETGCQAYHLCYNGRKDSFLCGPGTVFNQRILHCDYWYSVECNKSSQYYGSNAYMGSSQPEPGPAQASQGQSQPSYQASASANRPASFQRKQSSYSRNTQQVQEAY